MRAWLSLVLAPVSLGACALLLGDDFEITDGPAAGGASSTSTTGTAGAGGSGGAGGGPPQLPPLTCNWVEGEDRTLLNLQGSTSAAVDDDLRAVRAGDSMVVTTSTFDSTNMQFLGHVFLVHGDGQFDERSFGALDVLDVERVGGSRTAVLYRSDMGDNLIRVLVFNDSGLTVANDEIVVDTGFLSGFVDRAMLRWVPDAMQISDFIVALSNRDDMSGDSTSWFFRHENGAPTAMKRIAPPDVLLGQEDFRPQAFARIGGTNHLFIGFGSGAARYYMFDDNVTADPPPTFTLPMNHFGVGLAPTTDGSAFNGAFAILDGGAMAGEFYAGTIAPDALANLDIAGDLPLAWTLTDFADAPGYGDWGWYGEHFFLPGRREGSPEDLKLVIVHESGQLRVDATIPLMPAPPPTFQHLLGVSGVPNALFDTLAGEVSVAWTEVHGTPPNEYHVVRYGVLNCLPE